MFDKKQKYYRIHRYYHVIVIILERKNQNPRTVIQDLGLAQDREIQEKENFTKIVETGKIKKFHDHHQRNTHILDQKAGHKTDQMIREKKEIIKNQKS